MNKRGNLHCYYYDMWHKHTVHEAIHNQKNTTVWTLKNTPPGGHS